MPELPKDLQEKIVEEAIKSVVSTDSMQGVLLKDIGDITGSIRARLARIGSTALEDRDAFKEEALRDVGKAEELKLKVFAFSRYEKTMVETNCVPLSFGKFSSRSIGIKATPYENWLMIERIGLKEGMSVTHTGDAINVVGKIFIVNGINPNGFLELSLDGVKLKGSFSPFKIVVVR